MTEHNQSGIVESVAERHICILLSDLVAPPVGENVWLEWGKPDTHRCPLMPADRWLIRGVEGWGLFVGSQAIGGGGWGEVDRVDLCPYCGEKPA